MKHKRNKTENLTEYKFHYHLDDDLGSADKYFMARDRNQAAEMFDYACRKSSMNPTELHVSKWNRWKGKWEELEDSALPADVSHN